MSITSYFFPISKDKGKRASIPGSVSRTNSEGKVRSRPTPYPDTSEKNPSRISSPNNTQPPMNSSNVVSSTSNPDTTSFRTGAHPRYVNLKRIADETMKAIERGSFDLDGMTYDLQVAVDEMRKSTEYWSPDAKKLVNWSETKITSGNSHSIDISLLEISSLEGTRFLDAGIAPPSSSPSATTTSPHFSPTHTITQPKIGLLNFASATKPGGGFLNGASAQEESIARSSTLYYSLTTRNGAEFYKLHKRMKYRAKMKASGKGKSRQDPDGVGEETDTETTEEDTRDTGFYTHAMIYSPSVLVFRDDSGSWLQPLSVDVLTSAAVNAGDIRAKHRIKNASQTKQVALEARIEDEMKERMARILRLFVLKGVRNVVLGSFGTGVFKNNVEVVARLWKELLVGAGAPFEKSFDRVVFAILGRATYETFAKVFQLNNGPS